MSYSRAGLIARFAQPRRKSHKKTQANLTSPGPRMELDPPPLLRIAYLHTRARRLDRLKTLTSTIQTSNYPISLTRQRMRLQPPQVQFNLLHRPRRRTRPRHMRPDTHRDFSPTIRSLNSLPARWEEM